MQDSLLEKARLGIEADTFLSSNLGRKLIEKSREETEKACVRLLEVDPTDARAIARCQMDALVSQKAIEWLAIMVQEGNIAEMQIREEDAYINE